MSSSRPTTRSPSARSPLWSYSFVIQGRSPGSRAAVSSAKCALDVEVVDVDRRRHGHRRCGERVGVVEAGHSCSARISAASRQRLERAVVLEHPREHVLAGEQLGSLANSGGQHALADQRVATPSAYHASWSIA